jgi:phosphoribosyl 1,2-cyclic phosphodiesterase
MKITFWGTRGSIASPGADTIIYGGNTTCVEVTTAAGETVVIDSGTGIRRLGDELLAKGRPLDIMLIMTHIHWDHIVGFPFFAPIFQKNAHIKVDGSPRGIEGLKHVFSTKYMDGTWPLRFEDLSCRVEPRNQLSNGSLELDGTLVESHPLQHPQGGIGVKFTESSGSFVFLTDNELRDDGWTGTAFKDFVAFCRDVDLLIHDCQYIEEEIELRRGWGHSDLGSVARLAMEANVRHLILFHHDPWRTDKGVALMIERCQEIFVEAGVDITVEGAREGAKNRL